MNYDYDLLIVGGGPAGSITAIYAARQGIKVLLVDKARFPRDKVCGDAIPPSSLAILEELALLDKLLALPHVFVSLLWHTENDYLQLPDAKALVCKRFIFDSLLFEAAKSHADTREGWKVENLLLQNGQVCGIQGTTDTGESFEVTAKIVVGADGCSSVVARKMGLYQPVRQSGAVATRAYYRHLPSAGQMEFYYLQESLPGYLWIFPVDSETVNVGVLAFDSAFTKQGFSSQKLLQNLLNSPLLRERFTQAKLLDRVQGWHLPLASQPRIIHGNGFILVGDAAGLVDPFMGHGIDTAMISGKIAGQILGTICGGKDYNNRVLQIYTNTVWQQYGSYFERRLALRKMLEPPQLIMPMNIIKTYLFNDAGVVAKEALTQVPSTL
ncbi:geranylgeranyl reductase [Nostoc sp. NIES-4103]|nr:geranylgeranyl reductase [Nostoc sp. NIES-4103]